MTGLWHRYAWLAYAALLGGVLGQASVEFFSVLAQVEGPELAIWRTILGGVGLAIITQFIPGQRDFIAPFRTHGVRLLVISLSGVTLAFYLFHHGLDFATPAQVATLHTTIPVFVTFFSYIVFKTSIPLSKLWSSSICLIGIACLVTGGYIENLLGGSQQLKGMLLVIASVVVYSFYTVFLKSIIEFYGALRTISITLLIGGFGLWLLMGLLGGKWLTLAVANDWSTSQLSAVVILGLWNTAITQFLWVGGLSAVPDISKGSYLFYLKPVIATGLAVIFLKQSVDLVTMVSVILISGSVFWETLFRKKPVAKLSSG